MNPESASLDRLHDIVAPPSAPWWPPAPGWYWLLGLGALAALAFLLRAVLRWQRNRYRREALEALATLERSAAMESDRAEALAGISELLKRTALTAFPRPRVASLSGAEWLAFLDHTGGTTFSSPSGQALLNAVIDPGSASTWNEARIAEITAASRQWIRDHQAPETTGSMS